MPEVTGVVGSLTDATGISKMSAKKIIKDAVLDFLLSLPPALVVVGIADLPADMKAWMVAGGAVLTVAVKVVYRALLRWAQTE